MFEVREARTRACLFLTRVVPLLLLMGPLFALDAVLGLAYLNTFSALATTTVLMTSMIGGCGYGALVGRRIIRKLRETGIYRPSRKEMYFLGLAIIVTVAGFLTLVISIGPLFTRLMMVVIYSFLPATFVTEAVVLLRWENNTGRRVEYEGLWAIRAAGPTTTSELPLRR